MARNPRAGAKQRRVGFTPGPAGPQAAPRAESRTLTVMLLVALLVVAAAAAGLWWMTR